MNTPGNNGPNHELGHYGCGASVGLTAMPSEQMVKNVLLTLIEGVERLAPDILSA